MTKGAPAQVNPRWRWLGILVPGLIIAPIGVGLGITLAPLFLTPKAFQALFAWPGLGPATWVSLWSGVLATSLSLAITLVLVAVGWGTRPFRLLTRFLSPLLSIPHAATALGLAFLVAPSGWVARLLSPWATGWTLPPDLMILNDPLAMTLTLGLVLKEIPFLLLMTLAALPQSDASRRLMVTQSLGAGRVQGFCVAVLPAIYRQIRLPVYAVLVYSMTTVDMAMILGPTRPPTLSVQIVVWTAQGTADHRLLATSAALWQLGVVVLALIGWHLAERAGGLWLKSHALRGVHRGTMARWAEGGLAGLASALGVALVAIMSLTFLGLALWSITGQWTFPAALPHSFSLRVWMSGAPSLAEHSAHTLILGLVSAGLSLAMAVIWLALGAGQGRHHRWVGPLIYIPLLVPQVAFLPGLQVFALGLGWAGNMALVTGVHVLFVFPYVFLSFSPSYLAWDDRIARVAASLGATPLRILLTLRLPMLLRPMLTAFAVGFAVSVAQYLPTLLMSGGRVETLTTEAVALSSGGNRRLIGAYALLQMGLPALAFGLALFIPALIFSNRKGMEERHA